MQVTINNKKVRLNTKNVIGVGGEATVFKHKGQAVKIYTTPDALRDKKLRAMHTLAAKLPPEVIAPQDLVFDQNGKQVIGFTMRLLDSEYVEIRKLASKKYRGMTGITARDVGSLFLKAGQILECIHQVGMIVGDFNDLNLMFHSNDVLYIDVDSFQFDQFPCLVGTEAFIDPALYGYDLSQSPHFKPENDWYSFAVLLFKSLLLTHPYGGVHNRVKLLPQRAMQQISVFDPSVKYPRIAYAPELLTDELHNIFEDWFSNGYRGVFDLAALQMYIHSLKVCPSCDATYPVNRSHCPMCAAVVPVTMTQAAASKTLLQVQGEIVAWQVAGSMIRLIAHENGKAVYYQLKSMSLIYKLELFNALPTAKYAFSGDYLIVSPAPESDDLMVLDVSGTQPTALLKTTTEQFGNEDRVFGANQQALYRVASGYLMRGQFRYGQLVEQPIMAVAENQTWLQVDPESERIFGYFRAFRNYTYWLLKDTKRFDVRLSPLEQTEFLIDMQIKFAASNVLIMRHTQLNGVERIRLDEIDNKGRLLQSLIINEVSDLIPLDAHAYAQNALVYATDSGIVNEQLDTRASKTFVQTEPVVQQGDRLFAYERGLLTLSDKRVLHLTV